MFDLEIPGFRYSRIANPTTDMLEKRVAKLEGGVRRARHRFGPGRADLRSSQRSPITAAPSSPRRQLYGTTHTLLAHTLKRHGIEARFAKSDRAEDIAAADRRDDARGRSANRWAIRLATSATSRLSRGLPMRWRAAYRRQHGRDADPPAADRSSARTSSCTR